MTKLLVSNCRSFFATLCSEKPDDNRLLRSKFAMFHLRILRSEAFIFN